jgi:hypothetical protein
LDSQGTVSEKYFPEIEKDLAKLNSIIYGYQNVWDKYIELYQIEVNYYKKKYSETHDEYYLNKYKRCFKLILENLDKSLNMNYLSLDNHVMKLLILPLYENKKQHLETVKDCFIVKIFVDFAKKNQLLKEQITVTFGNENKLDIEKRGSRTFYRFTISSADAEKLSNDIYSDIEILKNYGLLKKKVAGDCDSILMKLYPK